MADRERIQSVSPSFLVSFRENTRRKTMNLEKNTPRLLGAMFLIVIATSAIAGTFLDSAIGSGSISDILSHIPNNLTMMHISILGGMLNSTGIVVLAVLLYIVLKKQSKIIAVVALGLWLT
jgi:hypothetical protein